MHARFKAALAAASSLLLLTGCPQEVGGNLGQKLGSTPSGNSGESLTPSGTEGTEGTLSIALEGMPADTWSVASPMAHERGGLSAGIVDGRIFAIGGDSEASIEQYDPATDTWNVMPLPPMEGDSSIRSRHFGGAVASRGKIYYVGGTDDSIQDQVDVYNPETNLWDDVKNRYLNGWGFGRMGLACAVVNGEVFAIGGLGYLDPSQNITAPRSIVASFYPDVTTGYIEAYNRAPLPTPRAGLGAGVIDSRLYVVGGYRDVPVNGSAEATGSMLCYRLNDWSPLAPDGQPLPDLNVPRHSFGTTVLAGRLYVAGGLDSDGHVLDSIEEYDPKTNQWVMKASMPTPRAHVALTALGGRIFALGGFDAQGKALRTVAVYRP